MKQCAVPMSLISPRKYIIVFYLRQKKKYPELSLGVGSLPKSGSPTIQRNGAFFKKWEFEFRTANQQ